MGNDMITLVELKRDGCKLQGPRVYLRVLSVSDATEDYAHWLGDPEVNRFLATKKATVPELREYITTKNQKENCVLLGIFLNEGPMIGTVKLEYIDLTKGTADIAIMLGDRRHAGKGLGGEAMKILIDYAFLSLGLQEITLGVIAQNTGAIRAYERLGFRETSRKLGVVKYGQEVFDHVTMSLTK